LSLILALISNMFRIIKGTVLNRFLSILIAIFVLSAIGMLIYSIAYPVQNEKFTEFYLLGQNGKADEYPSAITLQNGKVASVQYGDSGLVKIEDSAKVTLVIINQEQQKTVYRFSLSIDNETAPFSYLGISDTYPNNYNLVLKTPNLSDPIELLQGQKWEGQISFVPAHPGLNQKVEFLLYKDGSTEVYYSLHLWVEVRE
jgi:uncharacterized membrane protein